MARQHKEMTGITKHSYKTSANVELVFHVEHETKRVYVELANGQLRYTNGNYDLACALPIITDNEPEQTIIIPSPVIQASDLLTSLINEAEPEVFSTPMEEINALEAAPSPKDKRKAKKTDDTNQELSPGS